MDDRDTAGGAPDLGLRYLGEGLAGSHIAFRRIGFEQVARVRSGRYRVATTLSLDVTYAVSFDLDPDALASLLGALPTRLAAALRSELEKPARGALSVGLPRVVVDLTARLGDRQGDAGGGFAPFEVVSAGPPSALAAVYVTER